MFVREHVTNTCAILSISKKFSKIIQIIHISNDLLFFSNIIFTQVYLFVIIIQDNTYVYYTR